MIFNYDFVTISSLSGMNGWGEFDNPQKMVEKLEELRKKGELHAINHSVLMTGYTQSSCVDVKATGSYKLSFINNEWVIRLNIPTPKVKNRAKKNK